MEPLRGASGTAFAAVEGQQFFGTVATLSSGATSDATALILWGDGTSSTGQVQSGQVAVTGRHVYAEEGPYVVAVQVSMVDPRNWTTG